MPKRKRPDPRQAAKERSRKGRLHRKQAGKRAALLKLDPGDPFIAEETMQAGKRRLRRVELIERWFRRGAITKEAFEAATAFAMDFEIAGYQERFATSSLTRSDGRSDAGFQAERVLAARTRVIRAITAVGEIGGSILWDVVGQNQPISTYVQMRTWSGRSINADEARGALKTALFSLAAHYGYH